jgi:peptidoglycan/xylan/chitin deacetylase (PgdA/CDA1 family)
MMYLLRIPSIIQSFFPEYQWQVANHQIALTFDDGPNPDSTAQLLALLKQADVPATHFLLGKQVEQNPDLFQQIIESGHAIGHHSYSHWDGWKLREEAYVEDVIRGQKLVDTNLFRPPYGKITKRKWKLLQDVLPSTILVMFSLMPGDFELEISSDKLHQRMIQARGGDIIVLHDTPMALEKYAPFLLEWVHNMKEKGLEFVSLQHEQIR